MKTIRFFLLWCMVVAISACTPFYRGFEGSTLVSPARPDVSVSVVDMPMLAHGQISNAWEWDPLSFSGPMAQQNMGTVFGGESFYGSVRIVNGAKDPFAPLFAPEDQWASLDWLVQRFACLNDFRRSKLILEYREPLPASLKGVSEVPVYNEAVQAFRERAAKVFHVQYGEAPMPKDEAPYIKTLNARYMGNFLGSMSVKEPLFPNYSD